MTAYVFDTSTFRVIFRHYYRGRFPSFWERFDTSIREGQILSAREVLNEIESFGEEDALQGWAKLHRSLFSIPDQEEIQFVTELFRVHHFQSVISTKSILAGKPVADPFVVAKAFASKGTVVTQELLKENAAKIPNICAHFGIPCTDLEGFMEREEWTF